MSKRRIHGPGTQCVTDFKSLWVVPGCFCPAFVFVAFGIALANHLSVFEMRMYLCLAV